MTKSIYETLMSIPEASAASRGWTAAKTAAKSLGRFIPGVGLAAGGYDAYQRAKQGDYTGAALSAGAGLAGLVPGVGTAAATGLIGAQLGRDYKKGTGAFASDDAATPNQTLSDEEIKAASTPNELLVKFDDGTSHTYANVKKLPTDSVINARIKKDFPNKNVSNIVKGKF